MLGHQGRRAPVKVSAYGGAGPGQGGIRHAVTHLLTGKIDALPRRLLGEGAIHRQRQGSRDRAAHRNNPGHAVAMEAPLLQVESRIGKGVDDGLVLLPGQHLGLHYGEPAAGR
ncbi:hypothetical protein D3C81_1892750 [compost metagenome]